MCGVQSSKNVRTKLALGYLNTKKLKYKIHYVPLHHSYYFIMDYSTQIDASYEEGNMIEGSWGNIDTFYTHNNNLTLIPDDIIDMDEDRYNDLVERTALNNIIPYLTMSKCASERQCDWIKRIYRWSSKKEYSGIYENSSVNYECIRAMVSYLASKIFSTPKSKAFDFENVMIDDEIFEEILISKQIDNFLLAEYILVMIQSYPADKFEHYISLILEHHDLQKIFDDTNQMIPFCAYRLNTLNIIADSGIKLNFEELLIQCCRNLGTENDLIDKIYYAIDNLEINNLSNAALAAIYDSAWLEIIIAKTDAGINFTPLGSIHLMTNIDKNKMDTLTKYGYDFKEMINHSTNNHVKERYIVDNEQSGRSKYLVELLEDMNFDEAVMKQMLRSAIDNLYLVMPRY